MHIIIATDVLILYMYNSYNYYTWCSASFDTSSLTPCMTL